MTTDNEGIQPKCLYHYLFNVICFQFKVLSVEYFMDQCTDWELVDIIQYIPFCDRNLWESQRLLAYIDAKAHFKGIKSYDDICKLDWNDEQPKKNVEMSDEEIERLMKLAEQWKG